jgi:hypothetical protein
MIVKLFTIIHGWVKFIRGGVQGEQWIVIVCGGWRIPSSSAESCPPSSITGINRGYSIGDL